MGPATMRSPYHRCVELPRCAHYVLLDASVPLACLGATGLDGIRFDGGVDSVARIDIEVKDGVVASLKPSAGGEARPPPGAVACHLEGRMVWPTFVDLHTHIDKSHTCERSRNPTGSLSGADRSTDADAAFWNWEDVYRRMDFSLKAAYAHGTSALRTHLINMAPVQLELTWPTFASLRKKWAGKVELQGVALVALSFYRDEAAAEKLADTVAEHGGVLGACVCCAEIGGDPSDDWTTCEADRDQLLDRIFALAKARDLDLDFHVDENGNAAAKGLLHVSQKALQHGYKGRVVCGHCCSLAAQPPAELERILEAAKQARVTIVSLPLVNEWTQDRHPQGRRTPRWRGVTLAHEIAAAGVAFALASDNARDQFYSYGDLDMLEVFTQGVRISHLDRPYGAWPAAVTQTPARAMRLPQHGRIAVGEAANLVIFRGRKFSELLARPQWDRVVVRNGELLDAQPPDYRELDYVPEEFRYVLPPTLSPAPSGRLARANSLLADPLDKTASGPFTAFSQEQFRRAVHEEVQRRIGKRPPPPGRRQGAGGRLTFAVGVPLLILALTLLVTAAVLGLPPLAGSGRRSEL